MLFRSVLAVGSRTVGLRVGIDAEYREVKSVYIAAYRANCAVWDGSDKANELRMEMELLGQQARNDILQAMSLGLNSRAESIKMFYKDSYLEFCLTDSKGRRLNYDGGYFQKV